MIWRHLAGAAAAIAPAVANHLWQSTLFAIAAGLLTLVFRKNQARARYWLWLAASVKFLVPFSLLAGLGSRLAWMRDTPGISTGLYSAMEQIGGPFAYERVPEIHRITPASPDISQLACAFLAAVWFCGFAMVILIWCSRWRAISVAVQKAKPLNAGREVQALRRLERIEMIRKPIELRSSRTCREPGIFGIARVVLVWPAGISERLDDAQLEAVLAHEVRHVRRRDNLAASMHALVEAIFWFHPLAWWLGCRLLDERERACDEAVLELGSDRHVYAAGILKTCEFCVGFSSTCVSGAAGADLKKRIVHIMSERVAAELDVGRRLLLGTAGLAAIAAPIVFGLMGASSRRAQPQTKGLASAGANVTVPFSVTSNKPTEPSTAEFTIAHGAAHPGKLPQKAKTKTCSRTRKGQPGPNTDKLRS